MKIKKQLVVGTLALALVFGGFATPLLANAEDVNPQTNVQNGYGQKMGQYFAGTMKDTVAGVLGITVDELYSLRLDGNSIAGIAEDKGVAVEDITNAALTAKTEQIEQLYIDGKITEEQKDLMLSQIGDRMSENINRTEVGNQGKGNGKQFGQSEGFERGQGRGYGAGYSNNQ